MQTYYVGKFWTTIETTEIISDVHMRNMEVFLHV